MDTTKILNELPDYVPKDEIVVTEEYEFVTENGSPKTTYELNKAPFEFIDTVEAFVDGGWVEIEAGSGVTGVSTRGGQRPDSVKFTDSSTYPKVGSTFTVSYLAESILSRYIGAYDDDADNTEAIIQDIKTGQFVNQAVGEELDRIGSWFGEIGDRNNRTDEPYRAFLRSLVRAFNGTGTKSDIKVAVASAIDKSPSDVIVKEDFENTAITVYFPAKNADIAGAVVDMIQLAKASGVELGTAPIVIYDGYTIQVTFEGVDVIYADSGLGSGIIGQETIGAAGTYGAGLYSRDEYGS